MDRHDYYFRQPVAEDELDEGFEGAEAADHAIIADLGLSGACTGLGVTQATPTPNLTMQIAAGVAYDALGQRIKVPSTQPIDVSIDDDNASTAVGNSGNAKVISIFLEFTRALSDPRTDGNSATVYFDRNESFAFVVRQGAEALLGSEAPPALESDKILLCDIRRTFGQTTIVNSDVNPYTPNRRQDSFVVNGTATTLRNGLLKDLLTAFVSAFDTHKTDLGLHGAGGNITPGGRLSGSSSESVPAADIATASTLWYLPHENDRIALLDAFGVWQFRSIGNSGVSLVLTGLTSGKIYDVYAYWSGSAVALELGAAWTDDVTPADAITRINGAQVKNADHQRRLIGAIRTVSTTQTSDTVKARFIQNTYNRVRRDLAVSDSTDSWTFATADTFHSSNGLSSNAVEVLLGRDTSVVSLRATTVGLGNGAVKILVYSGIGDGSTTVSSAQHSSAGEVNANGDASAASSSIDKSAMGYHKYNWLEASSSVSGKFAGDNGAALLKSGMSGHIVI